jgi:hypothetical protein
MYSARSAKKSKKSKVKKAPQKTSQDVRKINQPERQTCEVNKLLRETSASLVRCGEKIHR